MTNTSAAAVVILTAFAGGVVGCTVSSRECRDPRTSDGRAHQMRLPKKDADPGMTDSPRDKWVTGAWIVDESHSPVEVGFIDLAAVYHLDRAHPCFQNWLTLLKKSRDEKATIVFDWTDPGPFIVSLERADKLIGVVEKIFDPIEETSVGFTIPHYAGIFIIPHDHPVGWLDMIHKSQYNRTKIVFAYDAFHRRVTSLARAEE